MSRHRMTDVELEAERDREALRREHQRHLLAIEVKLDAAGLNLDDLIELIDARRNGRY